VSIDIAAAEQLPGVHAVIHGGTSSSAPSTTTRTTSRSSRTRSGFIGDEVAAVAAIDEEHPHFDTPPRPRPRSSATAPVGTAAATACPASASRCRRAARASRSCAHGRRPTAAPPGAALEQSRIGASLVEGQAQLDQRAERLVGAAGGLPLDSAWGA
jgi:hypothetical protein